MNLKVYHICSEGFRERFGVRRFGCVGVREVSGLGSFLRLCCGMPIAIFTRLSCFVFGVRVIFVIICSCGPESIGRFVCTLTTLLPDLDRALIMRM